jgi:hypothetical protein
MDKIKFKTLKKVWPEEIHDFGRFAKNQDPMTYVLVSSHKISSEGFTDLKQDHLLDDQDCHDSELFEDYLEELRVLSK